MSDILIRNFAIIAHVDHGKSTLADRFLEITGVVKPGNHEEQLLDRNPISRERGITIKLAPVRMQLGVYTLNLIDTPGHVDFSYEVDRTLSCVEGVILLVDATQGVQAQTIANANKAHEKNLVVLPVINKIDLPTADVEKTKAQMKEFLQINESSIIEVSAKTGQNVELLLHMLVESLPSPRRPESLPIDPVQALIFDSYYDQHRGVIAFVRVFNGNMTAGKKLRLRATDAVVESLEVGYFTPELTVKPHVSAGEIGYVVTNLKDIHQVQIGDTIVAEKDFTTPSVPGYKKVKPMVFASIFPTDPGDYLLLKKALEKLYLNDSSLVFSGIYSKALGAGFRTGFLGLLHADVVQERLEREFGLHLVLTPPQVEYRIENKQFYEPYVKVFIITPVEYLGAVMAICKDHRARFITMDNKSQISLTYELPLSELISDFFDVIKSASSGYASFDWEYVRHEAVDADRLIILLNDEEIEEFSEIVARETALEKSVWITRKLKDIIPRQQYEVKIQAKFKGKIIASERVAPFRKDVTKKLYGGDRTRKDKLLEKQKEGKKKMKMIGKIEIPKETFRALFKR